MKRGAEEKTGAGQEGAGLWECGREGWWEERCELTARGLAPTEGKVSPVCCIWWKVTAPGAGEGLIPVHSWSHSPARPQLRRIQ